MKNYKTMFKTAAAIAITGALLAGCGTTTTANTTPGASATTDRHAETHAGASASLTRLYDTVPGSRDLVSKAAGVLVFPSVISAGLGIGGQYGTGEMRVNGRTQDYYALGSISVGLQAGAQSKALYLLFMTPEALANFQNSGGFSGGADASVAILKVGANGSVDLNSAKGPVVGFALTNAGLMANLSLAGTKITRLKD
ncbi:MAG: BPSL1445 family SYLF domain-containing lipoprotein [Janthinobacterium lividum]